MLSGGFSVRVAVLSTGKLVQRIGRRRVLPAVRFPRGGGDLAGVRSWLVWLVRLI